MNKKQQTVESISRIIKVIKKTESFELTSMELVESKYFLCCYSYDKDVHFTLSNTDTNFSIDDVGWRASSNFGAEFNLKIPWCSLEGLLINRNTDTYLVNKFVYDMLYNLTLDLPKYAF